MPSYEFEGHVPVIGADTYLHPEAVLIGAVTIGRGCFIGAGAVLRGDFGQIMVGNGSNVQENAVLHATPDQPVYIDDDVIVAHGALLHDATVKRGALIGMGAVLLHGVVIGEEAFVGAGAVVSPGFILPPRKIAFGNPAQIKKDVTDEFLAQNRLGLTAYQALPARYLKGCRRI